uniref:Uncharacterized protein n=1 Tax=Glossina austeni TaxID=7395 RepID=A0A1A9UL08_GLOAU
MEVNEQESGSSGANRKIKAPCLLQMSSTHIAKINCFLVSGIIIVFLLDTCMKSYPLAFENPIQVLGELFRTYSKQFATFNGGPKYCDHRKDINPGKILTSIRKSWIIHQEAALKDLEIALRNEHKLNSVALAGPIGVGKSLVVTSLIANFPWPDNVHTYAWNTNVRDEAEKFYMLRMIIQQFSDCGRNLLIIENLQDSDHALVPLLSELIKQTVNKQKMIIVFYVFNLSSDEYMREEQHKFLIKSLPLISNKACGAVIVANFTTKHSSSSSNIFSASMTDDLCSLNIFYFSTTKYSGHNVTQTESSLVNVRNDCKGHNNTERRKACKLLQNSIIGHKWEENHCGTSSWRTGVPISHKKQQGKTTARRKLNKRMALEKSEELTEN